jgi:hypothetical protein
MLSMVNRSSFFWILCVALLLAGCSAHKRLASRLPPFRLESAGADSVLLTPAIPQDYSADGAVKVTIKSSSARVSRSTNCSIERGPFRIEQPRSKPDSVQITLPPIKRWLSDVAGQTDSSSVDSVEALYATLADVDQLRQKGCFTDTSIRDFILQSLPMRPSESLFNAYGYRVGRGGLDLKPDMRLKIERAYFRAAKNGEEEHSTKNLIGVSTIYMDVKLASDNRIQFRRAGKARYSPASLARDAKDDHRDLALVDLPRNFHDRLLFYTYLVPKEHALSAAVIGAGSSGQLDQLDRELHTQTEKGCANAAAVRGASCFGFDGFVTLSAQIKVELNGERKFIDWGARIKDIVPANSVKSLRIQRQYMDAYYDVHFDSADSNVLSLALVGGDRLTWAVSRQ